MAGQARQPDPAAPPGRDSLRIGLDAIPYGFSIWDRKARLVSCNLAFGKLYDGLADRLFLGLSYRDFLHGVAHELRIDGAPDAWLQREVSSFGHDRTVSHDFADGRVFEVTYSAMPDGGLAMVVHDASSLKRGEHALRRAKELAEAADESKSRFLRAANHDLRQPLATLKILIYNCITEPDSAHRKDLLHAMDISIGIMDDLLGALLQIGQLDAGKIVPRVTTFQISQLLKRLEVQFSHLAEEKGLKLKIIDCRRPATTDKALLERILSNLVANAIRYTDAGRVLVGCRNENGQLRVEVYDTGRGIAPEHVERIFDEFYRVHDNRIHNSSHSGGRGLGLGLSIVKRLADILGHTITLRSTPGQGSRFAISVPTGNVWQSDIGEAEISEMVGGEFAGLGVLLVEDEEVLRGAMSELLERWGMKVHAVADNEQARDVVTRENFMPRLILADYTLREQRGTDIANDIRGLVGSNIPCIIITADNDPKLIDRIRNQGFPVLIKPVSPPRLRVLMHNLIYEPHGAERDGQ